MKWRKLATESCRHRSVRGHRQSVPERPEAISGARHRNACDRAPETGGHGVVLRQGAGDNGFGADGRGVHDVLGGLIVLAVRERKADGACGYRRGRRGRCGNARASTARHENKSNQAKESFHKSYFPELRELPTEV